MTCDYDNDYLLGQKISCGGFRISLYKSENFKSLIQTVIVIVNSHSQKTAYD